MQLFENGLFSSLLYVWINGFSWSDVDMPAILFYFLKYFLVQFPATYTMATTIVIDTDDGGQLAKNMLYFWWTEDIQVVHWISKCLFMR